LLLTAWGLGREGRGLEMFLISIAVVLFWACECVKIHETKQVYFNVNNYAFLKVIIIIFVAQT
jgi:hypothetical protein